MKNTILDHEGKVGKEENATPGFNPFIRKRELRWIIPPSDTTIYKMECRGEFPHRFALTPRCVAWNLNESSSMDGGTSTKCSQGRGQSRLGTGRALAADATSQEAGVIFSESKGYSLFNCE